MRYELLLCLLLLSPLYANENNGGSVESRKYPSPDKKSLVVVQTLAVTEPTQPVRVVSLIDVRALTCVYAFRTFERSTHVFWNPSGTRCLIIDSPDNGNTFLYLLSRNEGSWQELSLSPIMHDLEKLFNDEQDKGVLKSSILYRGGPILDGGIKWSSTDLLEIKTADETGYHLFRIALSPDGKAYTRMMTFLGPLDK